MTHSLGPVEIEQLQRLQLRSLIVGIVAAAVLVLGVFVDSVQFFRAYLVAYIYFLGIAHGCFAVLMVYYLTGGAWGFLIRRILEAGMRTLPLFAVLFVPLLFGLPELYTWAQPDAVAASKELQHKQIYLNVPFFCARAALYFVLWLAVAFCLSLWSRQQDRTDDLAAAGKLANKLGALSGPGLAIYGITLTFAAVDWIMSLQPAFRSTIFGPLLATGELLTGFSVVLIVLAWLSDRAPLSEMTSLEAVNDLGNLLFTFLILWTYMTFFQFMLIWIADLPYDVIWYLPRIQEGWQYVAWALLILHFAVPFGLLLFRDIKRSPRALAAISALLLVMHLVYINYQILPAFATPTVLDHWMDVIAPLAIGGLWLAYFAWNLKGAPILPPHDINQEAAAHYHAMHPSPARQEELHHV